MKRLTNYLMAGAVALGLSMSSYAAQAADKKITVVTWNIPYFTEGFDIWVAEFKKIHQDMRAFQRDQILWNRFSEFRYNSYMATLNNL